MTIAGLLEKTGWTLLNDGVDTSCEIEGAYCGDLLSWVMGNGMPGQAWITVQVHMNIVAVAQLREFSCILVADGANPPENVVAKAKEEGLPMIATGLPVFESAKTLIALGL